jgi:hypothetical protein
LPPLAQPPFTLLAVSHRQASRFSLTQHRQAEVHEAGAFEMEILIPATFLAGAIAGRFFKVFILIPLGIGAAAVAWLKCGPAGMSLLAFAGEVCVSIISLEFGYFAGSLLTGFSVQSLKLGGFRVRPRH